MSAPFIEHVKHGVLRDLCQIESQLRDTQLHYRANTVDADADAVQEIIDKIVALEHNIQGKA